MLLTLTGCGSTRTPSPSSPPSARGLSGNLTVFAAASLTDAFDEIGDDFMAEHPEVTVTFNFAGSSSLATQITQGAPADVFAAASPATMQTVVDADDASGAPEVFARNTLQIAVPAGNTGGITGLADLTDPERTVALCAAEVPCGAAAEKVFAAAGLSPSVDTYEQDVRAALTKVRLGEVDAALVYRTDVLAAGGDVEGLDIEEAASAVNDYPIAVTADAPSPEVARSFVAYVLSTAGQDVLSAAGFDRP